MSAQDKDQHYINLLRKLQRTRDANSARNAETTETTLQRLQQDFKEASRHLSPVRPVDPGPSSDFGSPSPSLPALSSYPPPPPSISITRSEDRPLALAPPPPAPLLDSVETSVPDPAPSVAMETSNGYPYSPDFENAVIAKQRRELHLLVDELRERDRELNDMVSSHQRQIAGWEADRRLVLQLEEKQRTMEGIMHDRQGQITNLSAKVEAAEQALREKHNHVMDYQSRTDSLNREIAKHKEINNQMQSAQRSSDQKEEEMSAIIRSLEAREMTLKDSLNQKEAQLAQTRRELQESAGRAQVLDEDLSRANQTNATTKAQLRDANSQLGELRKEVERYKAEVNRRHGEIREYHQRLERKEQELMQVKKDVQLGVERERRKDELLQSQKLKIERGDSELAHLRQLYERMQKDLSTLHANLETSKEMLLAESSTLNRHKSLKNPSPSLTTSASNQPGRSLSVLSSATGATGLTGFNSKFSSLYPPEENQSLARVGSMPDLSPRLDFGSTPLPTENKGLFELDPSFDMSPSFNRGFNEPLI